MKRMISICERFGIALCYLFGSQQQQGLACLQGAEIEAQDPESDIDVAVVFIAKPHNAVDTYAKLSLEFGELFLPFHLDLVFLDEVDHLIQFEAIQGINIYSKDDSTRDTYESKVMAFAGDESFIFKQNERDFLEALRDGYFEFEYQAHSG